MELKLIDFSGKFTKDYLQWCVDHPEEASQEETVETAFETMYETWFQSPKEWLGGKSPAAYFKEIDDPQKYATLFIAYVKEGIALPDPLLDEMLERKDAIYPILMNIVLANQSEDMDQETLQEIKAHAIDLMIEMQKPHPLQAYVEMLANVQEESDFTDALMRALELSGQRVYQPLLEAYPNAKPYAKICMLDLLSNNAGNEEVFQLLKNELQRGEADLVFLAGCLKKLGDRRAISLLLPFLAETQTDYATYAEIRNAVESLEALEGETAEDSLSAYLAALEQSES